MLLKKTNVTQVLRVITDVVVHLYLQSGNNTVTTLLCCYYTVVTPLLHRYYTFITLLLHLYYTVITPIMTNLREKV